MNSDLPADGNWSLIDVLTAVGVHKKLFFCTLIAGTLISIAVAYLLPRWFTASTLILPPQQQQSAANSALAQLGALAGVVGAGASVKSSDGMYLALMKTRRLQDALIDKFKLKERYGASTYLEARKELNERIAIFSDKKSGLITVEVEDQDAKFAADVANAHVDQLRKMLLILAVTDAQQRRVFFESQVLKTKESLSQAELLFRKMQKESGLIVSQSLAESGVKEAAQIKAQIAAKEVQLRIVSRFVTTENQDFQRVAAELGALRQQLNRLETGVGSSPSSPSSPDAAGLVAVQAFRDMKIQEALLEIYIRQLEAARADESREGPLLQQVDVATPPERALKPRRLVVVAVGVVITFFIAFVTAVLLFLVKGSSNHERWQQARKAWAS
jgi:tyrosine-protein kinase Etk/Wzc